MRAAYARGLARRRARCSLAELLLGFSSWLRPSVFTSAFPRVYEWREEEEEKRETRRRRKTRRKEKREGRRRRGRLVASHGGKKKEKGEGEEEEEELTFGECHNSAYLSHHFHINYRTIHRHIINFARKIMFFSPLHSSRNAEENGVFT